MALVFGLYFGPESEDLGYPNTYGLNDTFLPAYSHYFCQELQAESSGTKLPNDVSSAALYLVKGHPSLTDHEIFNFSGTASPKYPTYNDLSISLNKDSSVSFKVCYKKSDQQYDATFYLVKGSNNYYNWRQKPSNSKLAIKAEHLTSQCQTISYTVQEYGVYYFAFYSDSLSTRLSVDYQFDRTVYHIPDDDIMQRCSFLLDAASKCSITLPVSSGYTAVLSLSTTLPIDYTDGADIQLDCQPRAWLYAVVVLCAVFFTVLVSAALLVCMYFVVKKLRQSNSAYTSLVHEATYTSSMKGDSDELPPINV